METLKKIFGNRKVQLALGALVVAVAAVFGFDLTSFIPTV